MRGPRRTFCQELQNWSTRPQRESPKDFIFSSTIDPPHLDIFPSANTKYQHRDHHDSCIKAGSRPHRRIAAAHLHASPITPSHPSYRNQGPLCTARSRAYPECTQSAILPRQPSTAASCLGSLLPFPAPTRQAAICNLQSASPRAPALLHSKAPHRPAHRQLARPHRPTSQLRPNTRRPLARQSKRLWLRRQRRHHASHPFNIERRRRRLRWQVPRAFCDAFFVPWFNLRS